MVAFAIALAAMALASCAPDPDIAGTEPDAIAVRLVRVDSAADAAGRNAAGTVRLRREVPLAFVDPGRITELTVREGDTVASGALLARIDSRSIDSAVVAAESERMRAQAELSRQETLRRQGWVAQARVDNAQAAARAADAQLESRRFSQQFASIRAPSAGIILDRLAEPGETVAAGTPVLVLGAFNSGYVLRVGVGAADVASLTPGTVADILFRDGAAPAMRGTVLAVAGRADVRSGTFQVEFALPDAGTLRSGMIAEARWRDAGMRDAPLQIPATALFSARSGEAFVWRFDPPSGRIGARMVKLGVTSDAGVIVLSGLAPGDRIVAAGVDRLIEGQRVRPVSGA